MALGYVFLSGEIYLEKQSICRGLFENNACLKILNMSYGKVNALYPVAFPKGASLIFLLAIIFTACRGGDDSIGHTYVVITSNSPVDGENKFVYRVYGTCRGRGKKVAVELHDSNGNSATPEGRPTCNTNGNWAVRVDVGHLEEGTIMITAIHEDFVGRSYSTSRSVFKDTIPINLVINNPNNILLASAMNYRVAGSCTENEQAITVMANDDGDIHQTSLVETSCSQGTWEVELDASGLDQGPVTITATHEDVNGNLSVKTVQVAKDIEGSSVAVVTFGNIIASMEMSYQISGTCSESNRGVDIELQDDQETPNTVAPLTAPTCNESGNWSAQFDTRRLRDGNITIIANHSDSVGNPSSATVQIEKDIEMPILTIEHGGHIFAGTVNNYGLRGECSENERVVTVRITDRVENTEDILREVSCAGSSWVLGGLNMGGFAEGTIILNASQSDVLGNLGSVSAEIQKSNSALAVTIGSPVAINSLNENNYPLGGGCNPSGGMLRARIGGIFPSSVPACVAGEWSANFNLSELGESDSIMITVNYSHNAGMDHAEQQSETVVKDTEVPSFYLAAPVDANRITDSSYQLSGTCGEDGQNVEVSANIQGSSNTPITSQTMCSSNMWSIPLDISILGAGVIEVMATHEDLAGNVAMSTKTANRDNATIVTIANPPNIGVDNQSSYELSGTCSEEGGGVMVSVGGVAPSPQPTCSNFSWNVTGLDVGSLSNGEVAITVTHGSISESSSVAKGCFSQGETGTASNPITICNYNDLKNIQNGLHQHYVLGGNIDASASWSEGDENCNAYNGTAIASTNPCSGMTPLGRFTGSFNGNGHQINDLYINASQLSAGLFSELSGSGVIENLHLRSVQVKNSFGADYFPSVGGLVGIMGPSTMIKSCSVIGSVTSANDSGGLAGFTEGKITNSYTEITIEGKVVGALTAFSNSGTIINSYTRGTASGDGSSDSIAGGLIGSASSNTIIRNSYARVNISNANKRGLLLGEIATSNVFNCYGTGTISTGTGTAGGLIGNTDTTDGTSTVSNSFWNTETSALSTSPGGTGLMMAQMQVSCPTGSSSGICALGSGFIFSSGSYPKIKKCLNCDRNSPTFGSDQVAGQ